MTNGYNTPIGVPIGLPSILSLGLPPLVNPYPTLNLDFIQNPQFDSRITFTRGSQATLFDSTGTLRYAKHNLAQNSEDFSLWTPVNITITTDAVAAPNGAMTADAMFEAAVTLSHRVQTPAGSITIASGSIVTFSVFAKEISTGQKRFIGLSLSSNADASSYVTARWDLETESLTLSSASAGFTVSGTSIASVGNGWYRLILTGIIGSATDLVAVAYAANSGTVISAGVRGARTYAGSVDSGAYFWGGQVNLANMEGGVTSSLTTYYPTTTAAYYAPRFDYNPSTLQPRGLLIEEQRTNLETFSEDFSNAVWVKTNSTISSNAIIAPSGELTGDKLIADATTSIHSMTIPSRVYTINVAYAMSIFAKAGEYNTFSIIRSGPGGVSARFDLSTLTATVLAGTSASITSVGNGWYRCEVTWTSTQTIARTHDLRLENPSGTSTFLGDGVSGMFFWGIQTEAGAFATSYIPTTTTALTRNADVASMTGTNFSSWYNQTEGTVVCNAQRYALIASGAFANLWGISDNTNNERYLAYNTGAGQTMDAFITDGGASQATLFASGSITANTAINTAFAYKVNDIAWTRNAGAVQTDTSATLPTVDRLYIGTGATGAGLWTGYIQRIAYYPTRLPNTTLQALTA